MSPGFRSSAKTWRCLRDALFGLSDPLHHVDRSSPDPDLLPTFRGNITECQRRSSALADVTIFRFPPGRPD